MQKFYLFILLASICLLCACAKNEPGEVQMTQEQKDLSKTKVDRTPEAEVDTETNYVGFDLIEGDVITNTNVTFQVEDGWLCYTDEIINFRVYTQRNDYDFSKLVNYLKDNNFTGEMQVNEFDISNPDYVEELVYFKITSNVTDFDGRYVYRSYVDGNELYIYLWSDGTLTHYLYTPEFE